MRACGVEFAQQLDVVVLKPGHGVDWLLETAIRSFSGGGADECAAARMDLCAGVDALLLLDQMKETRPDQHSLCRIA